MSSSVKVGVRIRPLLAKERHQNNSLTSYDAESIEFKNQTFTYDYVFGMEMPQAELYHSTAAPMLKSFLDGFNVTIMAYGQTGSGKTYTMGTSDNTSDDPNCEGLIPRFVCDLFDNLDTFSKKEDGRVHVKVSFLEIYGEDVYDLLGDSRNGDRMSLPVRENDTGAVFVQGLADMPVLSASEALHVLSAGTKNRITASTAMNAGSSRSHAVFTITLDQVVQSDVSEDDTSRMISKLTFVDLAGSERIKRTGAEGQRMKEGIQINSGLFNLGQVINGLADDVRIKNGTKAAHIPYRNSKLTHLLKDALGGNSQTLFLACVSPAESNESETFSTLSYARQARNIQNKPIRNMDKHQIEIRRLKFQVKAWMRTAIVQMFGPGGGLVEGAAANERRGLTTGRSIDAISDMMSPGDGLEKGDIFQRPEVLDYISTVNEKINSLVQGGTNQVSPRKVRLSIMPSPRVREPQSTAFSNIKRRLQFMDDDSGAVTCPRDIGGANSRRSLCGILEDDHMLHSPEETEQLVSRMIELVHKEKEAAAEAHEGELDDGEESMNETAIDDVTREIVEKEEILVKLKDAVKGFAVMKHEYESLVHEINNLETERHELEAALEKAKKQEELLIAQKKPGNPVAMEKMKERFLKVKDELARMKADKQKKESAYNLMQRESKQCDSLQRELMKLKENKVALMRVQKQQSQQYQKFRKEQTQKMTAMKKSDVKKQRQMNDLKSELQKKVRVLGNKDREIGRIQSKLKACETHIKHLMANARVNRQRTIFTPSKSTSGEYDTKLDEKESTAVFASAKNILDNVIQDRVEARHMRTLYQKKIRMLRDIKEELAMEIQEKKSLDVQREAMEEDKFNDPLNFTDERGEALSAIVQQIKTSDATIDRITSEQNILNADVAELSRKVGETKDESDTTWEEIGKNAISGLTQTQCQALLWEMSFDKAELLGSLQEEQDKLNDTIDLYSSASERNEELQQELDLTIGNFKKRLDDAEKQRVQDIWSVLQGQSGTANDSVAGATESIALARAQELENALGDMVSTEADLRAEIVELQTKNTELQKSLQEKIFTSRSGGHLSCKVEAEEASRCFSELDSIWTRLGTEVMERQAVLTAIEKSSTVARRDALDRARAYLANAQTECQRKVDDVKLYSGLLHVAESDFYDHEVYELAPLLKRNEIMSAAQDKASAEIVTRSHVLYTLKDKLLELTGSMAIATSELSAELRVLTRLDNSHRNGSPGDLAAHFISMAATLSQPHISQLDSVIREMSIKRADVLSRSSDIIQKITPLRHELGYVDAGQFVQLELGPGHSEEVRTLAISLILSPTAKIVGNVKAVQCMDAILMSLMTIKTNRENCIASLTLFSDTFAMYFKCPLGVEPTSHPSNEAYVKNVLDKFSSLESSIENFLASTQEDLYLRMTELGITPDNHDKRMSYLSDLPPSTAEEVNTMTDIEAPMTELKDMLVFIDENWLKDAVSSIVETYKRLQNDIIFAIILTSEAKRLTAHTEAVKEMVRYDNTLKKHVADMDLFEMNSSQNREKLLSGNSKHLLEEAKTRESNKHKYARISEKLLKSAHAANECSPGIPLDISKLSSSAQDLLRGKIQEKTELMHLHSTTHGTRRWSGCREDVENSGIHPNVEALSTKSNNKHSALPRTKPTTGKISKSK